MKNLTYIFWILVVCLIIITGAFIWSKPAETQNTTLITLKPHLEQIQVKKDYLEVHTFATVSAYNSLKGQTDDTECLGAGGYICGRTDVVACPRHFELGDKFIIDDKEYICLDRMNKRYLTEFDLFYDKDLKGVLEFGRQEKEIIFYIKK